MPLSLMTAGEWNHTYMGSCLPANRMSLVNFISTSGLVVYGRLSVMLRFSVHRPAGLGLLSTTGRSYGIAMAPRKKSGIVAMRFFMVSNVMIEIGTREQDVD